MLQARSSTFMRPRVEPRRRRPRLPSHRELIVYYPGYHGVQLRSSGTVQLSYAWWVKFGIVCACISLCGCSEGGEPLRNRSRGGVRKMGNGGASEMVVRNWKMYMRNHAGWAGCLNGMCYRAMSCHVGSRLARLGRRAGDCQTTWRMVVVMKIFPPAARKNYHSCQLLLVCSMGGCSAMAGRMMIAEQRH